MIGLRVRLVAFLKASRAVCTRDAFALWGYLARLEGRVPSECTFRLRLSRMPRGLRTPEMRHDFEAIPHASRVARSRNPPPLRE